MDKSFKVSGSSTSVNYFEKETKIKRDSKNCIGTSLKEKKKLWLCLSYLILCMSAKILTYLTNFTQTNCLLKYGRHIPNKNLEKRMLTR